MPIPLRKSRQPHPHCDVFNDYLDRGKNVVGSVWKPHDRTTWTATILAQPVPAAKINEHATMTRYLGKDFPSQDAAEQALWKAYRWRQTCNPVRPPLEKVDNQFPVAINSEVDL
jgi:hypothetical protein